MKRMRGRLAAAIAACGTLLFAAPAAAEQYVIDGGFEAGAPVNPNWAHQSTVFESPFCDASCGTGAGSAGPRTGSRWAWFGGTSTAQTQSISQQVSFPADQHVAISFWLWSGLYNSAATLVVQLDDATSFELDGENQSRFTGSYHEVIVPLGRVPAGNHTLRFAYASPGGASSTNINVDDVALEAVPAPALPAPAVVTPATAPPPPNAKIVKVTPLVYKATTGKTGKTKRANASYKAKQGKTGSAKMSFVGEGGEGELRFECAVDRSGFQPCTSPHTFRGLSPGAHRFAVRAIDSTGRIDQTPAKLTQRLQYTAKQGKTGSAKK